VDSLSQPAKNVPVHDADDTVRQKPKGKGWKTRRQTGMTGTVRHICLDFSDPIYLVDACPLFVFSGVAERQKELHAPSQRSISLAKGQGMIPNE
jgi:hypothetical protein